MFISNYFELRHLLRHLGTIKANAPSNGGEQNAYELSSSICRKLSLHHTSYSIHQKMSQLSDRFYYIINATLTFHNINDASNIAFLDD